MRTQLALTAAAVAVAGVAVASIPSAVADEHDDAIPPHPHVLVLGAKLDASGDALVSYRKCVDVAANQALPLNAHHEHVHFGRAGIALRSAGHLFVPTAPAFDLPWTDCASLIAFFKAEQRR